MKNVWPLLLFILHHSSARIECNSKDNCLCLPGEEFEFQCPKSSDEPDFVIHVTEGEEILIDCAFNSTDFKMELLPRITIGRIERFKMRFCPLPRRFREVLDWFGISEVTFLQYTSFDLSKVVLTKDYFEGLQNLESLKIDSTLLVDVESDVFANTPNLKSIELQVNNLRLERNLFTHTPLLKSLDISENQLVEIPEGLFQPLDKLELLYLWSNNLTIIDNLTFSGLKSLKALELSSNKIETISENAFNSLGNLTKLNLSINKLQLLPSDIFSHNSKLELVIIKNNYDLQLPDYLFANMTTLKEVELTNSKLKSIPENIFQNCLNLKSVKLGRNNLLTIPENLFQGALNLEEIHLDNNSIEKIGKVFKLLKKLKTLLLQSNKLQIVEKDAFEDLVNLEEINLQKNQIVRIHNRVFFNNKNLKKIDLSHNQYSEKESNSEIILLENVYNAESIDLSHNLITDIDNVIRLYNKVNLNFLDLSHNRIKQVSLKDLQPLAKKLTVKLDFNNITTINFDFVDQIATKDDRKDAFSQNDAPHSVIFLSNNPLDCNCYNYDLIRFIRDEMKPEVKVMFDLQIEDLTCAKPLELRNMFVETVSPKLLLCSIDNDGCPDQCVCSWRPEDRSVIFECSNNDLVDFPTIGLAKMSYLGFNQVEMHLESNYLSTGPQSNLSGYDNITRLYLSFNEIDEVTWLPPRLKVLHLDHNRVEKLGFEVLDRLNGSSLENLTIDHNPWSCGCDAENFTNFLRQNTRVVDAKDVYCFNSTRLLLDLNRNDLCEEWQIVNLIVAILFVLLIISVTFALYYRYQTDLKVWLYAHNLCLWWVTEEELDKDKMYDAFISYSHKDEDFVVQNLLPVLEGGPQPYKLCLHIRDFIPGEFITAQITRSVLESRRTLVVLSPHFLESVWGKMEFRTAHTQAMTEGRARVIIVLYGDIDVEKIDDELKSYLKTNTYVKWGDPYFWNKLRYALPHSKRNVANNNQKLANVMRCIDDKFNLVGSNTPSPGTTPPALDPNVLKKHPLNFVPSPELDTPPAESGTLLVSTCL